MHPNEIFFAPKWNAPGKSTGNIFWLMVNIEQYLYSIIVSVPSQESERWFICMLKVSILPLFHFFFRFEFRTVLTVWYFLLFILIQISWIYNFRVIQGSNKLYRNPCSFKVTWTWMSWSVLSKFISWALEYPNDREECLLVHWLTLSLLILYNYSLYKRPICDYIDLTVYQRRMESEVK